MTGAETPGVLVYVVLGERGGDYEDGLVGGLDCGLVGESARISSSREKPEWIMDVSRRHGFVDRQDGLDEVVEENCHGILSAQRLDLTLLSMTPGQRECAV